MMCSAEGCVRATYARGLCRSHYDKDRSRPDWTPHQTAIELADALRSEVTDDCVIWTGGIDARGYARLRWNGKITRAHRYVCYMAHGPAPSGRPEAAHSCGVRACVNPRHLRWASKVENRADTRKHGTERSVISPADAREIRRLLEDGVHQRALSEQFNLAQSVISRIKNDLSWTSEECYP